MTTPTPTGAARVPLAGLGLVLAGYPACRLPVGLDGAPGLAAALAAHQRDCPNRRPADDVCPRCGCEAELYQRANGWRCGDCLAAALLADLATPATVWRPSRWPARPAPDTRVIAHHPRRPPPDKRGWPADRAVVA